MPAALDDPNLGSHVGLVPSARLGMFAGADTVDGMDVLADGDTPAFVKIEPVRRRAFGATKQDMVFGHIKIASQAPLVRGSNAMAAAVSTPLAARLVAATRRTGGENAASARETGFRDHVAVDQVFTDLFHGPLNHLPSS